MVKYSLRNMIEKYPYFFDKRPISNFYKITKVYNENFKLMYNDLFKVYEGAHLNKKIYIWKNQEVPYEYEINFFTNFNFLKSVKIYKNNILIYKEEYDEKDEVNNFEYTYWAKYTKNNSLTLYTYQCEKCGDIYFDYNLPRSCTNPNCDGTKYIPVKVYECQECGEIYFSSDDLKDCVKNNHSNSLIEVNVYKCRNCGQIYFGVEPPNECAFCYEDEEQTVHTKMTDEVISTILYSNELYHLDDNSEDYTVYGDNILKVIVEDENGSPLSNAFINLTCNGNVYKGVTYQNGVAIIPNLIDGEYSINVNINGYVDGNNTINIPYDDELKFNLKSFDDEETNNDSFNFILPPIPEDKFLMVVETYDEYELVKGFPENDYTLLEYMQELQDNKITPNAYDHDYSLDLIGALNNIPRKKYKLVHDNEYPYTEPPYNNKLTEDDYHYMNRIIKYALRLWASIHLTELNLKNNNYERLYAKYKDYFDSIGITREDYDNFINDSLSFVQSYNPVSLELWKIYGIDSRLVNRERYLLKVFDEQKHPFDESTGLVKCWTPQKWEHKDRFCDGSIDLGEYFFVDANTVRPIKGQNVDFTFKVLNSLAEPIDEDYYVDVYKIENTGIDSVNNISLFDNHIYEKNFRLSYHSINPDKPTILLFKAFKTNGELLGSSQVVLNTRTHADWYVNAESKEEKEDGSKSYPFKTLQKAIDNVNSSLNLICLQSNITINEPLIINQNTIIIGEDKVNNKGNRYVPRIFQKGIDKINSETLRYKRDFFKLVGNKDCELTLSNLRLVSGQINSFVGINTWKNTNNSLDIFESVVVHGGTVNLSVSFINQQEYYPFDFINCKFKLLKKDKTPLSNNIIQVYYKNQLITSLLTDENGECNYKFNLKETKIGEYTLHIVNKSEVFFEADIGKVIHVDKEPHYYYPHKNDDVKLEITKYTTEDAFNLYSDTNGLIDNIELSDENEHIIISEDTLKYKIENLDFGRYIFYSTNDNDIDGNVKEEWIVESLFPIAELPKDSENKTKFIKNLVFNNLTGDIIYDVFELPSNPKMQDLEDIILDVKPINNGTEIEVTTFRVPFESMDYEELLYSEAEVLMSAITEINLNMETGILSGKRLGKFW